MTGEINTLHAAAGVVVIEDTRTDQIDAFINVVNAEGFAAGGMNDDASDSISRVIPLAPTKEFYRWMNDVSDCVNQLTSDIAALRQELVDKGVL